MIYFMNIFFFVCLKFQWASSSVKQYFMKISSSACIIGARYVDEEIHRFEKIQTQNTIHLPICETYIPHEVAHMYIV